MWEKNLALGLTKLLLDKTLPKIFLFDLEL